MKPAPFTHHAPTSVEQAVGLLHQVGQEGKVLAGGQSLIPAMNMRLAAPTHLVDINRLPEADRIEVTDEWVRIGPLVRHEQLRRSSVAHDALPLLRAALDQVAHPAIRNRGTTVGSVTHADAAGEMPAVLALCRGIVEATGPDGVREIAAGDFFSGPLETTLDHDELVTGLRFARFPAGTRTGFWESARRSGDYALAGVALAVGPDFVRASFVSVTEVPDVLDLTAAAGHGADAVADAVREHVRPEADLHATADYRRALVTELTLRGLAQLRDTEGSRRG